MPAAPPGTSPPDDHVVIFAGGVGPSPTGLAQVPPAGRIIAADSGMDHAIALGVPVDVLVGDLDSVSPAALAMALASGTVVDRRPSVKDETDLELAVALALSGGARRLTVLGGHGGRLDHLLANVALLAAPALAGVEVRAVMGPAAVTVVRSRASLHGRPGELVSLLPVHGPAEGVTTTGLHYALRGEDLAAGSARGVSNTFVDPDAVIAVRSGTLVAVQPEAHR